MKIQKAQMKAHRKTHEKIHMLQANELLKIIVTVKFVFKVKNNYFRTIVINYHHCS